MLDYILRKLEENTDPELRNAIQEIFARDGLRKYVTYDANKDRLAISRFNVDSKTEWLLRQNGFGYVEKKLSGTDIYIRIDDNIVYFGLK